MQINTAVRRIGRPASVLAVGALLACASAASAATFNVSTNAEFNAAVAASNASVGVTDTIQFASLFTAAPTAPVSFTDDVIIRGNPTSQVAGDAGIQGAAISPANDLIQVQSGVTATFQGMTLNTGGDPDHPLIHVFGNGTFRAENSQVVGSSGVAIQTDPESVGGSIELFNSIVTGNTSTFQSIIVAAASSITMNNVTYINNGAGMLLAGTANIRNSVIGTNGFGNCVGVPVEAHVNFTTDTDVDGDGLGDCTSLDPAGQSNLTVANSNAGLGVATLTTGNGGPTRTRALTATSVNVNSADQSACPPIDQRYFVRTNACDRGSYELNAVRDTTPPTCAAVATRRNGPSGHDEQDVSTQDTGSGLEAIFNQAITNGSISVPTFTVGRTTPLVITATKTDQSLKTRWSFTARDWAGNTTNCQ